MADPEQQLASFIAKFTSEVGAHAEAVRNHMRRLYPTALELVYDNYNALAIGYAPGEKTSEAIFSIALYPRWVSLFFLQAKGLPDPDRILKGGGSVARHVVLESLDTLHNPSLQALMQEAVARARAPFPARGEHQLIIKSVSARQRPRRPAETEPATIAKKARRPSRVKPLTEKSAPQSRPASKTGPASVRRKAAKAKS